MFEEEEEEEEKHIELARLLNTTKFTTGSFFIEYAF